MVFVIALKGRKAEGTTTNTKERERDGGGGKSQIKEEIHQSRSHIVTSTIVPLYTSPVCATFLVKERERAGKKKKKIFKAPLSSSYVQV